MVSDDGQPTATTCASTSATFHQDRTELLNNHHRLGHISFKRARSLNIDGIPQPPSKMPKVKCPVCIASKATRHKRPSASTADTRSASGPWQKKLFGSLRRNAHLIHKRISILCSIHMRMVRCQTNLLHARITSSTHIVDSWQLQASSHNTSARFEQIREENTSTTQCKLS